MMIVIEPCSPLRSFAAGEDRPRHLEFSRLAGEYDHVLCRLFPARLFAQRIAQGQERVERDEALVVQYGTDSAGNFAVHLLSIWAILPRSCQQVDHFILRTSCLADRKLE